MSRRFFLSPACGLFGLSLFIVGMMANRASAHDPGFSTATVTIGVEAVEAVVTFSRDEVEAILEGENREPTQGEFREFAGTVLLLDGHPPVSVNCDLDEEGNAICLLVYPVPSGETFQVLSPLFPRLLVGHRQHLIVRDHNHDLVTQKLFSRLEHEAEVGGTPAEIPVR